MIHIRDISYAIRHIRRFREYSLLNVIGLALGMASAILILLWIEHEVRTDKFHLHGNDIYLMHKMLKNSVGQTSIDIAMTGPFAPVIEKEIPEVIAAVRVTWKNELLFRLGDKMYYEEGHYADSAFFKVFSFPFVAGDSAKALNDPNSVVISETLAEKYFGKENAIGKTIHIRDEKEELFTVTGVFEDPPVYSSLTFDFILPYSKYYEYNQEFIHWDNFSMMTYLHVQPNTPRALLDQKLNAVYKIHGSWKLPSFFVQPFEEVHLYGDYEESKDNPSGLILYVKIFSLVALFIIFLAGMNYTNLATAIATKRGREVGVKKVFGSGRSNIFRQFTLEAVVLTFFAFLLSIFIVELVLPYFNKLIDVDLVLSLQNPHTLLIAFMVPVITGVLSGIFPAFYMSAFKPITILKNIYKQNRGLPRLRQSLVVFQFIITIAFIISSLLIFKQIKYIQNKTLGLNEENVVFFPQSLHIMKHRETFKQELEKQPGIISVTYTSNSPLEITSNTYGTSWRGKNPEDNVPVPLINVDYDFCRTFDIDIIAGRDFSKQFASDTNSVLINKIYAQIMGMEDPVGEVLNYWGRKASIIGIVKDFHIGSMHLPLQQLLIINRPSETWLTMVRIDGSIRKQAIQNLERTFRAFDESVPFEYQFIDEKYAENYESEKRLSRLALLFTILSIVISCLGLFGLALFTAEQRTKEIGIRKSIGAKTSQVMALLTKKFLGWVLISFGIASLIAYYAMHSWLEGFAYRTTINLWVFITTGAIAITIALITVSWQAYRAANRNPVESLRYE